jgi:hypothetical protein
MFGHAAYPSPSPGHHELLITTVWLSSMEEFWCSMLPAEFTNIQFLYFVLMWPQFFPGMLLQIHWHDVIALCYDRNFTGLHTSITLVCRIVKWLIILPICAATSKLCIVWSLCHTMCMYSSVDTNFFTSQGKSVWTLMGGCRGGLSFHFFYCQTFYNFRVSSTPFL